MRGTPFGFGGGYKCRVVFRSSGLTLNRPVLVERDCRHCPLHARTVVPIVAVDNVEGTFPTNRCSCPVATFNNQKSCRNRCSVWSPLLARARDIGDRGNLPPSAPDRRVI